MLGRDGAGIIPAAMAEAIRFINSAMAEEVRFISYIVVRRVRKARILCHKIWEFLWLLISAWGT